MSRPRRRRRVCALPEQNIYGPLNKAPESADQIHLTIDEFETIRLIDYEGLNQEECALRMDVGRTTVQATYTRARKKIALSLVDGLVLKIQGGDYVLCQDQEAEYRCGSCGTGRGRGRRGRYNENRNSR